MHPARPRPRRAAAVATAVLLVAASLGACRPAGSSGSSESQAEPAPAVSVPGNLSIDGFTPSPKPSGTAAPPADDAPSAEPAEQSAAARCADLQEAWAATNRALVDLSPDHPRSLVASFRDAHRAVTSVEPPADVTDAWTTMEDYLGEVVEAFDGVDADDLDAVTTAMTAVISEADTARATGAAEDVTAYLSSSCAGS